VYPSEFVALVSSSRVPLRWRRLFALGAYTFMRPGELEALRWEDVDLVHGAIHIHRAVDRARVRGRIKATKTNLARRVPIEPELLPLLRAMRQECAGRGPVLAMPSPGMLWRKVPLLPRAGGRRAR
jgi:integrase